MTISPEHLLRLRAVLEARTESFTELASLGGLDPARSFRGADLRHVDFATDDLSGYDFSGADLTHAKLGNARASAAIWDSRTVWPGDWRPPPTWADDWGTDQFGPLAIFLLSRHDGSHLIQRMRWAPPGNFFMGSPVDEEGRRPNEGPQHHVAFAHGFWMFETACTEDLWQAVTGEKPKKRRGPAFPVTGVSWYDVQEFLKKLNKLRPDLALSLPSEAQWEYACRAGTTTRYHFGNEIDPAFARYESKTPVRVGSLPPNAWGMREMHGNAWEWCADAWHPSYKGAPDGGAAWHANSGDIDSLRADSSGAARRVVRGGSCSNSAIGVRAAFRSHGDATARSSAGFRCARVQVAPPSSARKRTAGSGKQAERTVVAAASVIRSMP